MPPWFLAEPSALAAVLRYLSASDLVSLAAASSRVQDALAAVLLHMASGSTALPVWLPVSGNVHLRISDAKRRVGIDDTPNTESSVTPDTIASYAMVSASIQPVPEVEWHDDMATNADQATPFLIRDWVKSQRWRAATDWAPL